MNDLESRIIHATRDLILIESTDDMPSERQRCFQWIRNHLEEIPGLNLTTHHSNGYESLLALPEGISQPEILLCGHLDVVDHPEPDSYRSRVRDGRIYGPGAGDMKGQLAILMRLLRNAYEAHSQPSIGLAVTSDEEKGGENGVRYLIEECGLRCAIAIIPDGGCLDELTVEEKGIIHLTAHAMGTSAHAARPWLGDNPLEKLMDSLSAVREKFSVLQKVYRPNAEDGPHWYPTLQVTSISTPNESPNRIPETASAVLDVRFTPPYTVAEMLDWLGETVGPGIELKPIVGAEPTHLNPDPLLCRGDSPGNWPGTATGQSLWR